jgi:hypothetical protein
VNECPVPVIRTGIPASAARRTSAATSAAVAGDAMRRGLVVTLPAQFRQTGVAGPSLVSIA